MGRFGPGNSFSGTCFHCAGSRRATPATEKQKHHRTAVKVSMWDVKRMWSRNLAELNWCVRGCTTISTLMFFPLISWRQGSDTLLPKPACFLGMLQTSSGNGNPPEPTRSRLDRTNGNKAYRNPLAFSGVPSVKSEFSSALFLQQTPLSGQSFRRNSTKQRYLSENTKTTGKLTWRRT